MKRKIVHVLPFSLGGVNTILTNIVSGTVDDYDVTLFIVGDYENIDQSVEEKLHLICLNQKRFFSLKMIMELLRLIKRNDIVHVHLFPALYLCAFLSFFFRGKNFIYTEHASMNNRRRHNMLHYIEIPIYNAYNSVIAVSESCKNSLENWLDHKVYIQVINNGINMKRFHSQSRFDFKSKGIDSKYIITMVARLSVDKDFHTIIEAMSLLGEDYHLVLVGEGDLRPQIEMEIRNLSLMDKITLLGYCTDVMEILASSTLSVLSSYAEGMGIVILESLAAKTPCIGSDVDGIKDVLPSAYRFERGNSVELAELIRKVITNNIETLHYDDILEKYSVQKMIASYRQLYSY